MKTIKFSFLLLSLVVFTNCFAQRERKRDRNAEAAPAPVAAQPAAAEETPVVTEECLINISLFNESARNKQYADAVGPWNKVFNDCPGAQRVIYQRGREILHWQLSQVTDAAERQKLFEQLMLMYEMRAKYFGNDPRYPTPWIKGLKALDYIAYSTGDELKKPAYEWLEYSIDGLKEAAELEVMRQFLILSNGIYKADNTHAEKFIADYLKVSEMLDKVIAQNDANTLESATQLKSGLDGLFVQSGAADCATLDKIYSARIKTNSTDIDYLSRVLTFYRRVGCTESEVFFAAAVAAHKIKPSNESANALAEMSYKKNEFPKAIAYWDEATKLATDKMLQADYQFKIAQVYYNELKNFSRAREHARNSLEFNPNNGTPWILIGIMYASTRGISDNPVLSKAVYWAAVDKFVRAKQVDQSPKNIEDADRLIRTYSQHFPSREEIFFQPELQAGQSYFVGGWIGESTIVR